jgi:hypothetical protein
MLPRKEGKTMRKDLWMGLLAVAMLLTFSACSARTKLALEETRKNGAHFATWSHMGYSVNRGTPERTTKRDIDLSTGDRCTPSVSCPWYGEVVRVQPIQ